MNEITASIQFANSILPGIPIEKSPDPRWQAIIAVGEYIRTEPDSVWQFTLRWADHPQEDLRDAIATCLLEHLLEYHFEKYFPLVEEISSKNLLFADTFLRCWQFGQSEEPANAARFDALQDKIKTKVN